MPLLPFADAKARLIAAARAPGETEMLDLAEASGRVLADDLRSPIDVPGFDNTAMDGYAVRAADAASAGTQLPVSQRIAAGSFPEPLATASAARIFTGAPLPAGADAVVMQEDCREADGVVTVEIPPVAGQHVRRAGSDIARDSVALPAGTRWVFDDTPFFLLLNLAVGGKWPGYPDATTPFPQEYRVDYVRVYARE